MIGNWRQLPAATIQWLLTVNNNNRQCRRFSFRLRPSHHHSFTWQNRHNVCVDKSSKWKRSQLLDDCGRNTHATRKKKLIRLAEWRRSLARFRHLHGKTPLREMWNMCCCCCLMLSDVVWRLFAQYYGAPLKLLIYFLFSWQRKILNVRTNIIISNNNRGVIATIQRSSLVCGWFVCFSSCCLNGAHLCSISIKNCLRRRCLRLRVRRLICIL